MATSANIVGLGLEGLANGKHRSDTVVSRVRLGNVEAPSMPPVYNIKPAKVKQAKQIVINKIII